MSVSNFFRYRRHFRELPLNRITLIMGAGFFVAFVIFIRLVQLQVIQAKYYKEIAFEKNYGYTEIPARRGDILIQDRHSGEPFALATNTTLNMVYADPTLIEDPIYIAEKLAPLLFDLEAERERDEERYETLLQELEKAGKKLEEGEETEEPTAQPTETTPIPDIAPPIPNTNFQILNTLSYNDPRLHTDEELFLLYKNQLLETLSQKTRPVILLGEDLDAQTIADLKAAPLVGIELTENGDLYAYPAQIANKEFVAKRLGEVLQTDAKRMERILLGRNRYVVLKRKLAPKTSAEIERLSTEEKKPFFGIRMQEEYFRFYPEQEMAAQVLGYITNNRGQYGIEERFNSELKGQNGFFSSQIDASGKQITVGDSEIQEAVNGANITLTIDRAIQAEAEKIVKEGVEKYQADSAVIIVQEPKTGKILAMAHYPTFNPNAFGDVYELKEIELSQNDRDNLYVTGEGNQQKMYLYIRKDPDIRIEIFYDAEKDKYYKYANDVGPDVYQLKSVTLPYEPGSVFKPIAMAAGIDAGEVTPYTTFNSSGPVKVDEYEIHTFNDRYYGLSTMTDVLIHSDNTGMVFVARKLGKALLYDYLQNFGFLDKTKIEFEGENSGKVEYYDFWAESELVTKAFGQGISVTPIQLITAISAIANGGLLMQPYIVESVEYTDTGKTQTFDPKVTRRALKEKTANEVKAMMIAVVEGSDPLGRIENYFVAGKTGTAQTYKHGKALKGVGTTNASMVGFAPINDPQFTVLVKVEHPKTTEWGATTAGPMLKQLVEFLVNYYNIPPDKK